MLKRSLNPEANRQLAEEILNGEWEVVDVYNPEEHGTLEQWVESVKSRENKQETVDSETL